MNEAMIFTKGFAQTLNRDNGGRHYIVMDVSGTLCARDGIKTGQGCPNGQDAYDGKLIVWKR